MKAVILFGSPRRDGNTRQLVNAFTETLRGRGDDVRVLYLNEMNIRACQGCLSCSAEGICRINDDMKDVRKFILDSEILVYASPIYWSAPSGQLKIVMDRCLAFLDADMNSRIAGKKSCTLLTCADDEKEMFEPSLLMFRRTFEDLGLTYVGGIEAEGCVEKGSVKPEILDGVRNLAASL